MVIKVLTKQKKGRFRIQIYDLKDKKSRTITLGDHEKKTVDDIKKEIIQCFTGE